MKTILWIYDKPLRPEVGGTERITSLIQRGLRQVGHNCMDILVIDVQNRHVEYHGEEVRDTYQFLKENRVNVVINQLGQVPSFLEYFLNHGGQRWHDAGGRIISCLHFDPKPISFYRELKAIPCKTWHDYYVKAKARLLAPLFGRRDMKRCGKDLRWVYDRSDAYILLSQGFIPYFKKVTRLLDLSKLHCINNPLTFEENADNTILDKKKNVILVVSRMYERQKRISLVLKAWKKLSRRETMKDWVLKIVGEGPDLERYKDWAAKNRLERISFEGQQSPEKYYCEAKISLITSITEGWGQTITESFQRGVVPVAVDTSTAFHDMIVDVENGFLVREGAMKSFYQRVEQLANDNNLWSKMATNALASSNKFSFDKITKEWEKIL